MPYHVRAFCAGTETPTITTVLEAIRDTGFNFNARVEVPSELDSMTWQQFELIYKADKGPIIVECFRDDGPNSLVRAECQEFRTELGQLEDSSAKSKVMEHLSKTRFIVYCQLLSDIDDDGYEANGQFLDYFVDNCAAVIHADGEGFYKRMNLANMLVPLK